MKALFLDFDGTLVDSIAILRRCYDVFLARWNFQGSDEDFARFNGPPLKEIVKAMAVHYNLPGTVDDLLGIYRGIIDESYDEALPAPGATALLDYAWEHDILCAIVTSNGKERVARWLSRNGWNDRISFIVGGQCVPRGKPFPDPYLEALSRAGCTAQDAAAVEDSPHGAQSAIEAGLKTYGLHTGSGEGWLPGVIFVPDLNGIVHEVSKGIPRAISVA
jgi:beta-phosphoglucomutase-like phosphatase (HAD superfamily)